MKNGWETCNIGDVLERTETVDPTRNPDKEFLYIDVSSVNNKTLTIDAVSKLKGSDAPSRARKLVRTDDVIFATVRPTLKRIALIPEQYDQQVCSTGYFVLRGKDFIDNRFLFYFLQTDEVFDTVEKMQKGASYPAITDSDVKCLRFTYPPIEEQRRIVAILDEAFAAIDKAKANTEKNIQNARELFDSYLNNIFSNPAPDWETRTIEDVCDVVNGGTPKTGVDKYWNGTHLWITPAEMGKLDSPYVDETKRRLSDAGLANSSARLMPPYSIILSSRAPIGHLVINAKPMATNQGCKGLVPKEDLNYKFLYYFLSGNVEFLNSLGTGATFKELSATALKNVLLPVPPIEEQRQIAGRVDKLKTETQRLETAHGRKIAELDELKRSILQKAFSGDL
jgi:type I restriction enzyme S subunit